MHIRKIRTQRRKKPKVRILSLVVLCALYGGYIVVLSFRPEVQEDIQTIELSVEKEQEIVQRVLGESIQLIGIVEASPDPNIDYLLRDKNNIKYGIFSDTIDIQSHIEARVSLSGTIFLFVGSTPLVDVGFLEKKE